MTRPSRFLVVDDVRFTRLTLVKILRQLGAEIVHEAGNGDEALQQLQGDEGAVDCIITDLEMPGSDGVALLRAIRTGTASLPRNTPVVLLTGHSDLDRIGPALQLDVDAFLGKPISQQAVAACLSRLFQPRLDALWMNGDAVLPPAGSAAIEGAGERLVTLAEVPDDAELARDLVMANGRLLLAAGSRLTARKRDLLRDLIVLSPQTLQIWIRA